MALYDDIHPHTQDITARNYVQQIKESRSKQADALARLAETITNQLRTIQQAGDWDLPKGAIEELNSIVRDARQFIERLLDYVSGGDLVPEYAATKTQEFSDEALKLEARLYPLVAHAKATLALAQLERTKVDELAVESYDTRLRELAATIQATEEKSAEVGKLLDAARLLTGDATLSSFAIDFDKRTRSSMWTACSAAFFFSCALIVATVCLPAIPVQLAPTAESTTTIILRNLSLVGPTLSTILIALVSIRVFLAERHNASVNRHRATSLKALAALLNSATDARVRASILAQAVGHIFAAQPSGYVKGTTDPTILPFLPGGHPVQSVDQ